MKEVGKGVEKKFTLITGATSGIGWELSKVFGKHGHNLLIIGRNEEKLKSIRDELPKEIEIITLKGDLKDATFIERIKKMVEKEDIFIEFLVNNAGLGSFGEFQYIDKDVDLNMIDINVRALTHLTKIFLPDMIKKNSGGVMNLCSTAAFSPGPYMTVYYATKAYVLSFTEGIKEEVSGKNIKISAISPGPTKTAFQSTAKVKKAEFAKKTLMKPEEVAEISYKEFMKGKTVVVPGLNNKFLVAGSKILPRKCLSKIICKVNGK